MTPTRVEAEAGEHSAIDAFNKGYKQAWDNATATTIERCAQKVDKTQHTSREMIAAELRAMIAADGPKDDPEKQTLINNDW